MGGTNERGGERADKACRCSQTRVAVVVIICKQSQPGSQRAKSNPTQLNPARPSRKHSSSQVKSNRNGIFLRKKCVRISTRKEGKNKTSEATNRIDRGNNYSTSLCGLEGPISLLFACFAYFQQAKRDSFRQNVTSHSVSLQSPNKATRDLPSM